MLEDEKGITARQNDDGKVAFALHHPSVIERHHKRSKLKKLISGKYY